MNASISVSQWLQASHSVPEKLGARRMDAKLMIVQGQNGRIVTIDPREMAVAATIWPN
jgi:hypothetical protein